MCMTVVPVGETTLVVEVVAEGESVEVVPVGKSVEVVAVGESVEVVGVGVTVTLVTNKTQLIKRLH